MAERKSPAGGADFVAKIVKDPKNPPATLMLTGYLGASSEDAHTRLYFDPNLSNYVEIPNDGILHTQAAATDDGLGATHVWIKRDAVLTYGPASSQRPKGTFLDGPIMQDHMAGAAAAARGGVAFPVTLPPVCGGISLPITCPATPYCPPSMQPCISLPVICNWPARTLAPPCFPHTVGPPCLMSAQVACPTVGPCPSIACHSLACQGPGGPGMQRAANMQAGEMVVATEWAYCTWFVCGPGGGGGVHTQVAGVATTWPGCTQACGPSFIGMGCGTGGGTMQMAAFTANPVACPRTPLGGPCIRPTPDITM
jgi:hypothetical protein